ncbi:MAG TPA: hypothetical protein VLE26_09185 [Alphaproteobacteria bacterium]|nr:hypothetical protein [Alphaproteobacteria bacterium]
MKGIGNAIAVLIAACAMSLAAMPALADGGGGDGGGLEPSGPGQSITTEAVANAIRAADDTEDLAKRARKAVAAAEDALKRKDRDEAKRQLETAERLHRRSMEAWSRAADAAADATEQLENAKTIGATPTELENLSNAAADASRQSARAKAAVDQTQAPLDALRNSVK